MSDNPTAVAPTVTADQLQGRWHSLVWLVPKFYPAPYELCLKDENSFRWRFRGSTPTQAAFEQSLVNGVLVQFAIVPNDSPQILTGLVVAYNPSIQDGHCYVAAMVDRDAGVAAIEGIPLFMWHLYRHWTLRKLYMEAAEFNTTQYESAVRGGLFKEEGRLLKNHYCDDRYWDMVLYAVYREDAVANVDRF